MLVGHWDEKLRIASTIYQELNYALLDVKKRHRLTFMLANKQIASKIDQGKTVEYTKLNKDEIMEKNSY